MREGPANRRPLVLVADDEEDIITLLCFTLEQDNFDVLVARDGEQAVRLALEHKPDVALLDVMMPRLDGYAVTRRLRENATTTDLPIILLTARVQQTDVVEGFGAGADDYIPKPFSAQEVGARVRAALGG